jgi:hypothetical protein
MVHAVISNVTSWCPSSYPDLRHKGPQAQGFGQTFSQKQGTKKPIMSMGLFVTATRTETLMVHSGGFEPPTARFVAEYSIQLSYECIRVSFQKPLTIGEPWG